MKYEYVNVKNGQFFRSVCYEHRKIIDEYAEKGYRFICFIPTDISEDGRIYKYDLVFEKDEP